MLLSPDSSYYRMLSILWDAKGRPGTVIPRSLAEHPELPVVYLGLLAALGLGDRAGEVLDRDEGIETLDREYAPPGWANLLGFETEEIGERNLGLMFKLGRDSDEVAAWDWHDGEKRGFDHFWGLYRESHPISARGTFEHLVWWRYGDPAILLAKKGDPGVTYDDVESAKLTIRDIVPVRPWSKELALDFSQPAVEGFSIDIVEAAGGDDTVEHAKFGKGKVLRRLDGDKLEIEFADGQKRTLLSRFVTPA